jgi:hypothetical protein
MHTAGAGDLRCYFHGQTERLEKKLGFGKINTDGAFSGDDEKFT